VRHTHVAMWCTWRRDACALGGVDVVRKCWCGTGANSNRSAVCGDLWVGQHPPLGNWNRLPLGPDGIVVWDIDRKATARLATLKLEHPNRELCAREDHTYRTWCTRRPSFSSPALSCNQGLSGSGFKLTPLRPPPRPTCPDHLRGRLASSTPPPRVAHNAYALPRVTRIPWARGGQLC
jgi:hypothetical protein